MSLHGAGKSMRLCVAALVARVPTLTQVEALALLRTDVVDDPDLQLAVAQVFADQEERMEKRHGAAAPPWGVGR